MHHHCCTQRTRSHVRDALQMKWVPRTSCSHRWFQEARYADRDDSEAGSAAERGGHLTIYSASILYAGYMRRASRGNGLQERVFLSSIMLV